MEIPKIGDVGALVLFTGRLREVVAFYRGIGVPLEVEDHGDGPTHYACELKSTHFAICEAPIGQALEHRRGGSVFFGFSVVSVDAAVDAARAQGAAVAETKTEYPWGTRALVVDPDGRTVELFQRPVALS